MDRGTFIRTVAGGTAALLPLPAVSGCEGKDSPAFEAWNGPPPAAGTDDPRLAILSWAVLAPSALNLQPWWVDLGGEPLLVHADRRRLLPATDPDARQTFMSTGTFIEFMALAAKAAGHRPEVTLFPRGIPPAPEDLDEYPLARIDLVRDPAVQRDPLFDAFPLRRTNRFAYDGPPLTAKEEHALREAAVEGTAIRIVTDPAAVNAVAALAAEGLRREDESFTMYAESIGMVRFGTDELERRRDGMDLNSLGFRGLDLFLMRMFRSRNDLFTEGFRERHLALARGAVFSARAFGVVTTPASSRAGDVDAGRAFARVHLTATSLGLALQPFAQVFRFADLAERLAGVMNTGNVRGRLLFRLGRASAPPRTARRAVRAFVGLHTA